MSRRTFSNYDPVEADLNAYLDREDREPETERARCTCGRFFSRPVGLLVPPKQCPACKDWHKAIVARSPLLQYVEGARNTHIALGRIVA